MALPAHLLRTVQVRLKSVGKEGHFTLEAQTVFRPYLPLHCSGVSEIYHMALPASGLETLYVRLRSVSNEGRFTVETDTVYRSYLASHCLGVTETSNFVLLSHALQCRDVWWKLVCSEGHCIRYAETLVGTSPQMQNGPFRAVQR
jgi:hypothetical protein